jgi:hypothetical protein
VTFELTRKAGIAKRLGSQPQAMSLIPSESYSFPDHFTRTVTPSRPPKNAEPEAAPVEMRRKNPSIVALPSRKPQPAPVSGPENSEAVRSKRTVPVPNPALRRASAPPPRTPEATVRKIALPPTLKPKVRWNMRPPAVDSAQIANNGAEQLFNGAAAPAQNVIQMKAVRHMRPPRVMPPPKSPVPQNAVPFRPRPTAIARPTRPAPGQIAETLRPAAVSNPQGKLFEMFATLSKRLGKAKMRRFIACESAALAVLLPLVILGMSWGPDNVALVWIMDISTIASAVAAALIPIIFFAFAPTLPEIER